MLAKNSLALAKQGYELMDKKRNILIRELMNLIEEAKNIQTQIDSTFTEAYQALQQANIEVGIHYVQQIAQAVPVETKVRIKTRSIMGTEIPLVEHEEEKKVPYYGFYNSSESVDAAREGFLKVAVEMDRDTALIQVRRAVLYPVASVCAMAIVVAVLVWKVLPVFEDVLESLGGSAGALSGLGPGLGIGVLVFLGLLILGAAVWLGWSRAGRGRGLLLAWGPAGALGALCGAAGSSHGAQWLSAFLHPETDPVGAGFLYLSLREDPGRVLRSPIDNGSDYLLAFLARQ